MKTFRVKVRYAFEGWYEIAAENREQAEKIADRDCGVVLGGSIHTSNPMHVDDWEFSLHPEKKILATQEITK